mmetsp:Transcript_17616/g.30336  ORF Transcript_17616/g.30336 Transcript_17616/m.30336 type:complete len:288 (-) Transcript_17616:140-1003(-)
MTPSVKWEVEAEPPRSRVRNFGSEMVVRTDRSICCAKLVMPRCRSIITELSSSAVGFALFCPAMSGAVPCTASKTAAFSPMLPLGVRPSPPMRPAARSLMMSPYKLGMTITSYAAGFFASCITAASSSTSSKLRLGYCAACSRAHSRNSPSLSFMMLALWTTVTFLRLCSVAYSKAYLQMRCDASWVMTLSADTTPGTTSCSRPLYSPSVFSRIITRSTSSYLVLYPGMLRHGRTFANSLRALRSVRFSDTWPLPIGVASGPFRPTLLRTTDCRASSETRLPPGETA